MYPTIYDAFKDLFGIDFPFLKLLQSFGFFVAVAFLCAAYFLAKEIRRREKSGQFLPSTRKVMIGAPATPGELITQFIFGFLIAWKLGGVFFTEHVGANPRAYILSGEGSIVIGILGGGALAFWRWRAAEKKKLPAPKETEEKVPPADLVGNITLLAAAGGLVGAKLFNIFENFGDFLDNPQHMIFSFDGLTMYGGLIVGGITVLVYARKKKINLLHLMDATAPSLMLAYGVGRIGCHIAGDGDWGIANTHPNPGFLPDWAWAYTYPHNVNSVGIPIPGCTGEHCNQLESAVYPTAFYEAFICISLFFVLWGLRKRFTTPGLLFCVYLILNGLERFNIELIRVNETFFHIGSFNVTQAEFIAVLLLALGGTGIWWTRKRNRAAA